MAFSFLVKNFTNGIKKDLSSSLGLNLSKPLQVTIQPNERCNARCLMCNCWHTKEDYINSEEIIDSLKQLRKWVGNNFFVQIAGGEPLIYKDIYDIFSYCADNGIICKISTNGIAFSENTLNKIIESKLSYLSVSLDSHLSEIHDKFRGVPNTFDRAVNGIKYLAENGNLTLGISSVIMKDNINTLPESVDFFLSLPIHRLLIQPIRPWTNMNAAVEKWPEYEFWVNDHKAMSDFSEYLLNKKKTDNRIMNTEQDIREWSEYFKNPTSLANEQIKKCRVGYDRLLIDYKGNIALGCGFGIVGNIKNDKLKDVWKSDKAQKTRQRMMQCTYPCTSNCNKELTLPQKVSKAMLLLKSGLFDKK